MKKQGFTLIELMIVMSIIGTLVAATYPSIVDYIERGHVLENKINAADWIKVVEQYKADNNGVIESSPAQEFQPFEIYSIPYENYSGVAPIKLTNYFQSSPENKKILEGTKKQLMAQWGNPSGIELLRTSPQHGLSNMWVGETNHLWPGYSPTDTRKYWFASWFAMGVGEYSKQVDSSNGTLYNGAYYRNVSITGSSLGSSVDKLCAPGFADAVFIHSVNPKWEYTTCNYVFPE